MIWTPYRRGGSMHKGATYHQHLCCCHSENNRRSVEYDATSGSNGIPHCSSKRFILLSALFYDSHATLCTNKRLWELLVIFWIVAINPEWCMLLKRFTVAYFTDDLSERAISTSLCAQSCRKQPVKGQERIFQNRRQRGRLCIRFHLCCSNPVKKHSLGYTLSLNHSGCLGMTALRT